MKARWGTTLMAALSLATAMPASGQESRELLEGPDGMLCYAGTDIMTEVLENTAPVATHPDSLDELRVVMNVKYGLNYQGPLELSLARKGGPLGLVKKPAGSHEQLDGLFRSWHDERPGKEYVIKCTPEEFGSLPKSGWARDFVDVQKRPTYKPPEDRRAGGH